MHSYTLNINIIYQIECILVPDKNVLNNTMSVALYCAGI